MPPANLLNALTYLLEGVTDADLEDMDEEEHKGIHDLLLNQVDRFTEREGGQKEENG